MKKDSETIAFTGAHLNAGNGVIQVKWEIYHGHWKTRGWPTGDVLYYETEDE